AYLDSDKVCLEHTRVEIIKKISHWISKIGADAPKSFFLHGPAGTGKSAISHSIGKKSKDEDCLGAFFHFDRTLSMDRTPSKALQSIAYNLAIHVPNFRNGLIEILEKDPYLLSSSSLKELWQSLISKPAKLAYGIKPVVIVIDALDECGPQQENSLRKKFLSVLMEGVNNLPSNFRVLMTSRLDNDVAEILEEYANQIQALNISNLNDTEHDIYKYILNRMGTLIRNGDLSLDQCQLLAKGAEGYFQWAYTVCEALCQKVKPGIKIRKRLEKFIALNWDLNKTLKPLDQLYKSILEELFDSKDEEVMNEYRKVMAQILAAFEPLSKSALKNLQIAYYDYIEEDDEQGVDAVIPWLGSLLTGVNDLDVPIRPVHSSVHDFLLDETRSGEYAIKLVEGQNIMAAAVVKIMTKQLHFNMCNLGSSYLRNSEIQNLGDLIRDKIPSELSYACCFWDAHLVNIPCNVQMLALIKTFIFKHSLYWMEVLGILNRMEVIARSMENMIQWGTQDALRLQSIGNEIRLFGHIFGGMIGESTPHLYISALPFLPKESLLRETYLSSFRQLIKVCKGQKLHWPALQAILKGRTGPIRALSVSPDGMKIASGSTDCSVHIWSVENGNDIGQPLEGHTNWVRSVAFSPDGKKIASGSDDGSILIWSVELGHAIGEPLQGHTDWVRSVVFSPDGKRIVSGSDDSSIQIWDTETFKAIGNPLLGHRGSVRAVAISPDGKKIVSGSSDHSARIWDVETGNAIGNVLQGHTDYIQAIAISPNGERIATASDDWSIRIWDIESGNSVGGPLQGHKGSVYSVAFSPDGKRLVSGSSDCSVRLWDTDSGNTMGNPLQGHMDSRIVSGSYDCTIRIWDAVSRNGICSPLLGHTDLVLSVAFSPDSQYIASGSSDNSVQIWSANTGDPVGNPLRGHKGPVWSIAFSPDGRKIVTGSSDASVQIWDTATRKLLGEPLEGHTNCVRSVVFSPDGQKVMSGSVDCSLRIWDTRSGKAVLNPLQGHSEAVYSVAFSPDGRMAVSGSSDCSLIIWDLQVQHATGRPLQGHTGPVWSVAFSPNGKQIVSGSSDHSVRIWDAIEGTLIAEPLNCHTNSVLSPEDISELQHHCLSFCSLHHDHGLHSHEPFEDVSLQDNGWICSSDSSLLLWIPPQYREGLSVPHMQLLISRVHQASLDLSDFVHGENWTACYGGSELSQSSSIKAAK
ncbi:hypothetical protein GYMLUDRAFT_173735, partial [Collybiopsis luxurians FD-317 M1]